MYTQEEGDTTVAAGSRQEELEELWLLFWRRVQQQQFCKHFARQKAVFVRVEERKERQPKKESKSKKEKATKKERTSTTSECH